jgi:thioesterase domain-containing protein
VLAWAWRAHLARKRVAAERLKKDKMQRASRALEQKRKEAQRLSAARRSQTPVHERPRVFGAHLSHLAKSLPRHRPFSATFSDISPISSGPDASPQKRLPVEHLTSFQGREVERVRAEYERARATTPSHQNEIFSQVGQALTLLRLFRHCPISQSPYRDTRADVARDRQ